MHEVVLRESWAGQQDEAADLALEMAQLLVTGRKQATGSGGAAASRDGDGVVSSGRQLPTRSARTSRQGQRRIAVPRGRSAGDAPGSPSSRPVSQPLDQAPAWRSAEDGEDNVVDNVVRRRGSRQGRRR